MRFLLIAPRFHTNLYYRVIALQNAGHIVKVLVLYKGKSEYYKDIEIRQLKLSFFSRIIINLYQKIKKNYLKTAFELFVQSPNIQLNKEMKEFQPDFILLKAYQNMLAMKTLFFAKFNGTKTIMFVQTSKNHIKGNKKLFQLNLSFFKNMNVIAYITPVLETKKILEEIKIYNIYYIPFVFPAKEFEINTEFDTIKIISVGKFVKRKDQLLLLEAFKTLIGKYDIELDFYGEKADKNYYNQITNFIAENSLSAKVKIYLNVPYETILENYKQYHIFVLPSYSEPAAYSIVEAMANGLAIVCSNQNGTKCYIKGNGYIFEAKNKQELIEKLKKIISNKEKLIQMKTNALSNAIQFHDLKGFVRKIEEISIKI